MFDIHCHLLYGVDDGPKTIEDSVALAEASILDGITHVVATPHANLRYPFDTHIVQEQLREISHYLNGRLTLGSGCDFHLSYENIQDALLQPRKYTINGGSYLLIEFADYGIPDSIENALFQLQSSGVKLIITHPERNPYIIQNNARFEDWIQAGCLVQITADSLLGRFGKAAEAAARRFLSHDYVHFIASDAHDLRRRPPRMSQAYEYVKKEFGIEAADRLCINNPSAAYLDHKLPPQPELRSRRGRAKVPKLSVIRRLFG